MTIADNYRSVNDGTSITFMAKNEGVWGNAYSLWLTDFEEDVYRISVGVYEASGTFKELESHQVAHTRKLNSDSEQMFVEEVLEQYSDYIDAVVNTHETAPSLPLHSVSSDSLIDEGVLLRHQANPEKYRILPGTFRCHVNAPGLPLIVDNGKGILEGAGGTGTLNYDTGEYQINYVEGSTSTASYKYATRIDLSSGVDGDEPEAADFETFLLSLIDDTQIDFEFLVEPFYTSIPIQALMADAADRRGNFLAFLNVPSVNSVDEVLDFFDTHSVSSSNAAFFGPDIIQMNENQIMEYRAPAPAIAALYYSKTKSHGPWHPILGQEHGNLNCIGVRIKPSTQDADILLSMPMNPLFSFYRRGAVIWEQRTALRSSGHNQHIHVRRLILFLRRILVPLMRKYLGLPSNQETWIAIRQQVDYVLATIKEQGAFQHFRVTCDYTNNARNANTLEVDIIVLPYMVLRTINIKLTATESVFFETL